MGEIVPFPAPSIEDGLALVAVDQLLSDLLAQTLRSELWAPEFLAEIGIGEEQARIMKEIW